MNINKVSVAVMIVAAMFGNVCKASAPVSAATNPAYSSFVNEEFTSKIIQNWNLQGEVAIKVKDILKFYFIDLDKISHLNFDLRIPTNTPVKVSIGGQFGITTDKTHF